MFCWHLGVGVNVANFILMMFIQETLSKHMFFEFFFPAETVFLIHAPTYHMGDLRSVKHHQTLLTSEHLTSLAPED